MKTSSLSTAWMIQRLDKRDQIIPRPSEPEQPQPSRHPISSSSVLTPTSPPPLFSSETPRNPSLSSAQLAPLYSSSFRNSYPITLIYTFKFTGLIYLSKSVFKRSAIIPIASSFRLVHSTITDRMQSASPSSTPGRTSPRLKSNAKSDILAVLDGWFGKFTDVMALIVVLSGKAFPWVNPLILYFSIISLYDSLLFYSDYHSYYSGV